MKIICKVSSGLHQKSAFMWNGLIPVNKKILLENLSLFHELGASQPFGFKMCPKNYRDRGLPQIRNLPSECEQDCKS